MADTTQAQYTGLLDMINGGGPGAAGQTFQGGPFSNMLNAMGVRPAGYQDRLAAARPQPRPMQAPGPQAMPRQQQPIGPAMPPPGQITATPLGLSAAQIGQMVMSDPNLAAAFQQALLAKSRPGVTGYTGNLGTGMR